MFYLMSPQRVFYQALKSVSKRRSYPWEEYIKKRKREKDQNDTAAICKSVPEGSQWGLAVNGSFMLDTFQNKTTNVLQIRPAGQH